MDTKKNYKENLTIVSTFYEKEEKRFSKFIESVTKFNLPVVIWDDGSLEEYYKMASSYVSKYENVRLIRSQKNEGYIKAMINAFSEIETEYGLKIDSDDVLLSIPEYNGNENFDCLASGKMFPKNLEDFLLGKGERRGIAGSIIRKDAFLEVYTEIYKWDKYKWFFIDDLVAMLRFINDYKTVFSLQKKNEIIKRFYSKNSISIEKAKITKCNNIITFLFYCMIFKDDEYYYKHMPEKFKRNLEGMKIKRDLEIPVF